MVTLLALVDDLGVRGIGRRRASSPAMLASSSWFSGKNRFSFWTRALAPAAMALHPHQEPDRAAVLPIIAAA